MITFEQVVMHTNKTPTELRKIIKGKYRIKILSIGPLRLEVRKINEKRSH